MNDVLDPRRAWAAYQPTAENPWDIRKVGHLYRRAAFGATWTELDQAHKAGPEKTVERLLQGGDEAKFEAESQPMAQTIRRTNNGQQLAAWWLYRMLYGPQPLREKLTLFWHNHFATSNAKVQNAGFMLGMYATMRQHALGRFGDMLQAITLDPAMLVWLDTITSKKGQPNENYARELMELFSLGIGNYTETDIREAAKAFTGLSIKDGQAVFQVKDHDASEKTVLGQKGAWKPADIVRICLEQKACAAFIVRKLFRFYVSETVEPTPELLAPLVEQFRSSQYDIGGVVKTILRSQLFYSPTVYRTRVKSPVDFALGIVRALEGRIGTTALATALSGLGQNVFQPPSVKGWDGGPAWLNGQTLLFRQNLALALTSTEDPRFGRRTDPAALLARHKKTRDEDALDFFLTLFLQGDVPEESRERLTKYLQTSKTQSWPIYWSDDDIAHHRIRAVCHLVLTLPEFQLD